MGCPSHTGVLVTLDDINASHPASTGDPSSTLDTQSQSPGNAQPQVPESDQGETSAKKTMPLLVVVVGFEGTPYRDDFDWGETIFEDDESLAAYYEDMSLGQFTFGPMNETCRLTLGWISYIELEKEGDTILVTAQDYSVAPKDSGYVCALIHVNGCKDEYYLVENRRYHGWDEALRPTYGSLSPDGGLVFWHVDVSIFYWDPGNVNGTKHHPAIMPLFIESTTDGGMAILGDRPITKRAFFDAKSWNKTYASVMGDYLTLPQYGVGNFNDTPADRSPSQVCVFFTAMSDDGEGAYIRRGEVRGEQPCDHVLVHHEAVAPTSETDGTIEYWECTICGKLFADAEATQELSPDDIVLAATGLAAEPETDPTVDPTTKPEADPPRENPSEADAGDGASKADVSPEAGASGDATATEAPSRANARAGVPTTEDPLRTEELAALIACALLALSAGLVERRPRP
ncbi:hypothetical protein [Parafannyhessea umbonata]|uniref:Uncharacterized protein n=1 Tax=Parafannyhessea umbonata TaxID=604330 RepID=A0A1H9QV90_9ACTN|nr:hypothetical protein [Parafannyhessea umbonata]SER64394.1 hypothetical protein SAMN05216446_1570 [Parafannyhessea umbonata]